MDDNLLQAWFVGRVPDDWFTGAPEVSTDRDEILVVGALTEPDLPSSEQVETDGGARDAARAARIQRFREDTRTQRMRIADEAQERFGRKVSWGARCGDSAPSVFTNVSLPVMTRLRLGERRVLDTLVDAGVARSRADALAWCVRLVREHQEGWIEQLRDALIHVHEVRADGPQPA
jgi:hypothetical protein